MTHYIIVRRDLPVGFAVAQVAHAAGESAPGGLPTGTIAVVLAAPSQAALEGLRVALVARAVPHVAIHEPDAPWGGQLTAIGLEPTSERAALKPLLSSLPLYGKAYSCPDCDTLSWVTYCSRCA